MLKNNTFLETIFDQIFVFWPPKMEPKSTWFNNFFENLDFAKILVFPEEN